MDESITGAEALKAKYVGKFIGPNKIADIGIEDFTTAGGSLVFSVTHENGDKDIYPEKGLVAVVSDEIKDYNHIRDVRVNLLVPQILEFMEEYDLPAGQLVYVLSQIGTQYRNHISRAMNQLWRGDDRRYIPGVDPSDDFTLLMAEKVNKKIPVKI